MLVEILKAAVMPPPRDAPARARPANSSWRASCLDHGQPVLLVAAHQCNWEWMLLGLSLELGYPVDAAYKPLVDSWAEREMKKLRTRFGSRLVPAKDLLADIIKRRGVVRAVAMVADQEPTTSEHKHWTRFLNRDTAFYMGPEEIARVTRFPVFFIGLKRTARGYYEMQLTPLSSRVRQQPRRAHRALRAPGRGADPRRAGGLAVVAQALEAEEAGVPGARARAPKPPYVSRCWKAGPHASASGRSRGLPPCSGGRPAPDAAARAGSSFARSAGRRAPV